MSGRTEISVLAPSACGAADLSAFAGLVRAGGEVARVSLDAGLARAFRLVFLRRGETLIGTAGLKTPLPSYRARIASAAGVALAPEAFALEFGWAVVAREERGRGHFRAMAEAAAGCVGEHGVFATSAIDNTAVAHVLGDLGFDVRGAPFMGSRGRTMRLLTRLGHRPAVRIAARRIRPPSS